MLLATKHLKIDANIVMLLWCCGAWTSFAIVFGRHLVFKKPIYVR